MYASYTKGNDMLMPHQCKDIILYHGSRGGLEGNITTTYSRKHRDFGKGFYMGENKYQAAGLVIDDAIPVLYTVKLKLSEFNFERVLLLNNQEWVYTILANRDRVPSFSALEIAKRALQKQEKADIIIGPIADDRMVEAMHNFETGTLTDQGIYYALSYVNYGNQYVAKTEFACSKIEILDEKAIFGKEADEIRDYAYRKRAEGKHVVQDAILKYRRTGLYLDEIIEKEQRKEKEETVDQPITSKPHNINR